MRWAQLRFAGPGWPHEQDGVASADRHLLNSRDEAIELGVAGFDSGF